MPRNRTRITNINESEITPPSNMNQRDILFSQANNLTNHRALQSIVPRETITGEVNGFVAPQVTRLPDNRSVSLSARSSIAAYRGSTAMYKPTGGLLGAHKQATDMAYELSVLKDKYHCLRAELSVAHNKIDNLAKNCSGLYYIVNALLKGVADAKALPAPLPGYSVRSSTMTSTDKLSLIEGLILDLAKESMVVLNSEAEAPDDFGTKDWDQEELRVGYNLEDMSNVLQDL